MRRRTIAAASAAAVAVTLGGFASSASADNSMPVAPADMHATDVPKVGNSWGPGGEVHFDVEPVNLVISEYSSGRGIEWEMWGPQVAVGTGDLHGAWIGSENEVNLYYEDVTIILFAPIDGYFTEYAVTGDFEPPQYPQDKTRGFIASPRPL